MRLSITQAYVSFPPLSEKDLLQSLQKIDENCDEAALLQRMERSAQKALPLRLIVATFVW